eukprot:COSAG04_NODE_2643_length_3812_cov_2.189604_2_plen_32_part_00
MRTMISFAVLLPAATLAQNASTSDDVLGCTT